MYLKSLHMADFNVLQACSRKLFVPAQHVTTLDTNIHGLNADQTLLTPYFGLKSTRSAGFESDCAERR